jgi:hypothetical protein
MPPLVVASAQRFLNFLLASSEVLFGWKPTKPGSKAHDFGWPGKQIVKSTPGHGADCETSNLQPAKRQKDRGFSHNHSCLNPRNQRTVLSDDAPAPEEQCGRKRCCARKTERLAQFALAPARRQRATSLQAVQELSLTGFQVACGFTIVYPRKERAWIRVACPPELAS